MPKIFISVDALEEKTASGVAAVSGEIVTFVELDKTAYLSPAVYFSIAANQSITCSSNCHDHFLQ